LNQGLAGIKASVFALFEQLLRQMWSETSKNHHFLLLTIEKQPQLNNRCPLPQCTARAKNRLEKYRGWKFEI